MLLFLVDKAFLPSILTERAEMTQDLSSSDRIIIGAARILLTGIAGGFLLYLPFSPSVRVWMLGLILASVGMLANWILGIPTRKLAKDNNLKFDMQSIRRIFAPFGSFPPWMKIIGAGLIAVFLAAMVMLMILGGYLSWRIMDFLA